MDPLRLAAQIVSGIGFLGAGVIMRKGDDTISGLTTAAWFGEQQVLESLLVQDFILRL